MIATLPQNIGASMSKLVTSINLRLPSELHGRLSARASRQRRSLNSEIIFLLEQALASDEARAEADQDEDKDA